MPYIIIEGPKAPGAKKAEVARQAAEVVARVTGVPPNMVVVVVKEAEPMAVSNPDLASEIVAEITVESGRLDFPQDQAVLRELTEKVASTYSIPQEKVLTLLKGRGGKHMEDTPKVVGLGGEFLSSKGQWPFPV